MVGAYLDGHHESNSPQWDTLSDLIVDAWILVAPPTIRRLLDPQS